MSRWIVSAFPPWLLLIGLIVVVAGGSVLIQRYVRRRFPSLTGDEHNDATRFTYGFIGFVYAFLVGFVVSSMWGQISTGDDKARAEGAAAVQMVRDSALFEQSDAQRVQAALLEYERAAIDEWDRGAYNGTSEAVAALGRVYAAYQRVDATTNAQRTLLATSYANLDKISQARTARLLTAREDTGPPWPLWLLILLTSAMVVGTVIVYGVEKPAMHYPMVVIVGVIVAANLFLILELAHPYAGEISTSSDPLHEVVAVLEQATR